MDEDKILQEPVDETPISNDLITPSEIAEAATENKGAEPTDLLPSDVAEIAETAEAEEADQVKVESADSSTKSGIEQVKTTLEKGDEPAPVINVNVDAPVTVSKDEASEAGNVTNVNVTNIYQAEGKENKLADTEKASDLTPSAVAADQSKQEEITEQPDAIRVEVDPAVTQTIVDQVLTSKETIEERESSTVLKEKEAEIKANDVILAQLEKVEKTVETVLEKTAADLTPATVVKNEAVSSEQPDQADGVRVETVEPSNETLQSLIVPAESVVDYGTMNSLEALDRSNFAYKEPALPSTAMEDLLKSYQTEMEETSRLFQEDFSKTIESIEKNQQSIDYFSQIIPPEAAIPVNSFAINQETKVDKLYDLLSKEASGNEEKEEEPILRTDMQKISLDEPAPEKSEAEDDLSWPISKMQTVPLTDVRVETNEKKVNPGLAKEILTTPEMKQLRDLSAVMNQVSSQLEALNEAQVTNNQSISTIANSVNTVNSVEAQKMIPGESEKTSSVKKEEGKKAEPISGSLSEYYLHAIYDALVSYGIKLRTY